MNEPRAPEVGDEESIDLIPVQQAELWGYNFIYLPCGHWYRFSNLENVFRDKGTCCLCRKCYFPMQVQWVPPQVPNPAAAFQATNQLNEWVQSRLGPPWHIFLANFVYLLSQDPSCSVEHGNVSHEFVKGAVRESLTGHTKITLWNGTSVLICPFYIHIMNSDGRYKVRNIREVPWDISPEQKTQFAQFIAHMKPPAKNGGLAYFIAELWHGDIMMLTGFATILKALVIPRVSACANSLGPKSLCIAHAMKKGDIFALGEVREDMHLQSMTDRLQQFFIMQGQ